MAGGHGRVDCSSAADVLEAIPLKNARPQARQHEQPLVMQASAARKQTATCNADGIALFEAVAWLSQPVTRAAEKKRGKWKRELVLELNRWSEKKREICELQNGWLLK
jgi:hypothetical protein